MVLFMITGILTPEEGFEGFNNPATITVGAMFVLSAAIFKTGVLDNVSSIFTSAFRLNFTLGLVVMMLTSGLISAFINDTAVVALMMPLVLELARRTKVAPGRLLMPLSFGALMGGVCTLIGTSTNILASGIIQEQGLPAIGMFEMSGAGFIFLAVGVVYMCTLGQWLLPRRKVEQDIASIYNLGDYISQIRLLPNAKSVGKLIRYSPLVKDLDIQILQLRRAEGNFAAVSPFTPLRAGDVLTVKCDSDRLKALSAREGIELIAGEVNFRNLATHPQSRNFEAMVGPNSTFIGKTLSEMNFRQTYDDSIVLAIRNRNDVIYDKISKIKLQAGDILLLRTHPKQMKRFHDNDDLIMLSEFNAEKSDVKKVIPVLLIMCGVIVSAAMDLAPIVITASIGVLALIVTRIINPEEAYKSIEWKVIFMLAGVLSMGTALEKTGGAALIADVLVDGLGDQGPYFVLGVFFLLTLLFTNVLSNNATAALLIPIAITTATSLGVDSRAFIMAVVFGASFAFMTPMGYQTNTMILSPGNYRFVDFLRVGAPLSIIFWLLATWILPHYFPL